MNDSENRSALTNFPPQNPPPGYMPVRKAWVSTITILAACGLFGQLGDLLEQFFGKQLKLICLGLGAASAIWGLAELAVATWPRLRKSLRCGYSLIIGVVAVGTVYAICFPPIPPAPPKPHFTFYATGRQGGEYEFALTNGVFLPRGSGLQQPLGYIVMPETNLDGFCSVFFVVENDSPVYAEDVLITLNLSGQDKYQLSPRWQEVSLPLHDFNIVVDASNGTTNGIRRFIYKVGSLRARDGVVTPEIRVPHSNLVTLLLWANSKETIDTTMGINVATMPTNFVASPVLGYRSNGFFWPLK